MLETVLIIIFTLLFLWVAWWKLDWAIVLCAIFLPTYLLRFQVWFILMTILEVMVLVLFVVWLVKIVMAHRGTETAARGFIKVQIPWKWLILLFILTGIVAVLISPDIRQALGLWKAYILEPILFFIVFVNVIKTHQQIRSVLWAIGVLTVVIGYVALLQYAGLMNIPAHYGLEAPMRATSVFPFPTAVGKLIGPMVALFLGLVLVQGKLRVIKGKSSKFSVLSSKFLAHGSKLWAFNKVFLIGVISFGFIGLMLSVSRGALLGIFAALIFISFFSRWKKWIWIALVMIVLVALLIPQTRDNITGVFQAADVSTDVRLVMWQGALRIIQDNPITGTGLASFPVVYEDYKEASHTEFFPNPDHLILTLWIELGLAGLVIFFWLIVRFFKTGVKLLRVRNSELRTYAVGLMAAMVVIIIHGLFDTPYFKNDLAIQFWTLVGLMVVLKRKQLSDDY